MTKGLINSSTKKDKLYKLSLRKNKTYKSYDKYITYRNTYNSLKRKAKESYSIKNF